LIDCPYGIDDDNVLEEFNAVSKINNWLDIWEMPMGNYLCIEVHGYVSPSGRITSHLLALHIDADIDIYGAIEHFNAMKAQVPYLPLIEETSPEL